MQLVGLVAAAVCVYLFAVASDTASWMYPWGFVLFEVSAAAVILAMTQPVRTPLHALLSLRPVRWVGQISYGLYLWHWPVSIALSEGTTRISGWDLALLRLAVTFGAATLSYYLVELPIRHGTFLKGWKGAGRGAVGLRDRGERAPGRHRGRDAAAPLPGREPQPGAEDEGAAAHVDPAAEHHVERDPAAAGPGPPGGRFGGGFAVPARWSRPQPATGCS